MAKILIEMVAFLFVGWGIGTWSDIWRYTVMLYMQVYVNYLCGAGCSQQRVKYVQILLNAGKIFEYAWELSFSVFV